MNQVIIYMGVLTEYQGIDLLIEAIPLVVREAPNVKFLIVGYPNEDYYLQKAQALGVERWIHFTGKVPHEELPQYLSLADIAVSPKISTTEANLKLFAYLAMGLPTVVFDNPVNREILGNLGIYATAGNTKSLAQALVAILQDRSRARQLGAEGRAKATADYSWLAVGRRLKHIYDALENSSVSKQDIGRKETTYEKINNPSDRRRRFHGLPFSKRTN